MGKTRIKEHTQPHLVYHYEGVDDRYPLVSFYNTVNCEGYMGKGIAYQFKMRYPENNKDYVRACKSGELHIGTIHYYTEGGIWIVNLPTKDKWREKTRVSSLINGSMGRIRIR